VTGARPRSRSARLLAAAFAAALGSACRQDMHDQPRHEPFEADPFFADGRAARPRVPGTVAADEPRDLGFADTGRIDGELADAFPRAVTRADLERGRAKYDVHCAPCHGRAGDGDGVVVRRGLRAPESFHSARLRGMAAGHFFDVMTRGFGAMFDVADVVSRDDRWAIAAYVRALQRGRTAKLADAPPAERARLEAQ
jgi:mono/diheme cytochrome c family protein